MSQVKTQPVQLIDPLKRTLCSKHYKTGKYPKSFGAFFASSHLKGFEEYYLQFNDVLKKNKWKATKFPRFTSLIRWLLSNGAPRTTIEAVLDTAVAHTKFHHWAYSLDESDFLNAYVDHKYRKGNKRPFDYSKLPKFDITKKQYYDGISSDF